MLMNRLTETGKIFSTKDPEEEEDTEVEETAAIGVEAEEETLDQ